MAAKSEKKESANKATSSRQNASTNMTTAIPLQVLPKNSASVIVCFVSSLNHFYLQLQDCKEYTEFLKLMKEINSEEKSSYTPSCVGEAVIGYSEDMWYRGEVVEILYSNQFLINFIDYGNSEVLTPSIIRKLDKRHCMLPKQAVPCFLSGIQGNQNGGWDNKAISWFQENIENHVLTLGSIDGVEGGLQAVTLFIDKNVSVAELMVENNLAMPKPVVRSPVCVKSPPLGYKHAPKVPKPNPPPAQRLIQALQVGYSP
jgi:hypothetical protein